jgi:DNA-binding HxlR family transcriptional regulator
MKGFSSKTLCNNIKRIREKWNYKQVVNYEISPRVKYKLTNKGQDLKNPSYPYYNG